MTELMQKDSEWSVIDGEPCRVIDFILSALVENGNVITSNKTEPYASVVLEYKKCHKNNILTNWSL